MKVEIKGFVHSVGAVQEFQKFVMQDVVIRKPAWVNEFGEKVGEDGFYKMTIFNSDIEKYKPVLVEGARVQADCYLNGRSRVENGATNYYLQLRPHTITVINQR